jgi:hypothetical protein
VSASGRKTWMAWTPEHDALLRAAVDRRRIRTSIDWDKVAWATGHSRRACHARVCRLGLLTPGREWTAQEDAYLTREWTEVAMRVLRDNLPGRSTEAILYRAKEFGLGSRHQGLMSVTAAAKKAGYWPETLRPLLERQGVALHRVGAKLAACPQRRRLYVAWDDVVAAVARDTALETPKAAARRLGVSDLKVYARLRAAGVPASGGRQMRLDPETIDRAMGVAA